MRVRALCYGEHHLWGRRELFGNALCCTAVRCGRQQPLPSTGLIGQFSPPCAGLVGASAPDADALCEGVTALVLKPAVLGGFERTAQLAAWAAQRGMRAVVSSAFESSLGLSQLAQLAAALEAAPGARATQHGLATLTWFAEDVLPADASAQLVQPDPSGSGMAVGVDAAQAVSSRAVSLALALDQQAASAARGGQPKLQRRSCSVQTSNAWYDFSLLEALPSGAPSSSGSGNSSSGGSSAAEQPPVLLLHGFMGAADDWRPLMQSLRLQRRCVALDLPGHGGTALTASSNGSSISGGGGGGGSQEAYSLEAAAAAVAALVQQEGLEGCQLVGYSLGARLALLLAARWPRLFSGVVSVSGGRRGAFSAGIALVCLLWCACVSSDFTAQCFPSASSAPSYLSVGCRYTWPAGCRRSC